MQVTGILERRLDVLLNVVSLLVFPSDTTWAGLSDSPKTQKYTAGVDRKAPGIALFLA